MSRNPYASLSDAKTLRSRALWLYHNRGWTQKAIAGKLGISRSTVIRILDEARRRGEIQVWINTEPDECTDLALSLEEKYGLEEAVVVPGEGTPEETANDVGAALGRLLTTTISDDMVIGATWGRTLNASLATFRPIPRTNTRIVSLLGGIIEAKQINPIEYSWRLASRLHAECTLFLAPLIVDSKQTKMALIEKCGISRLYDLAQSLDLAIMSCGDLGGKGTSLTLDLLPPDDRKRLENAGAIGEAGCNFLDAEGRDIDDPIRDRVMNVDFDTITRAKRIILASGGADRASILRATIIRTRCQTLVTDESAAKALLQLQATV